MVVWRWPGRPVGTGIPAVTSLTVPGRLFSVESSLNITLHSLPVWRSRVGNCRVMCTGTPRITSDAAVQGMAFCGCVAVLAMLSAWSRSSANGVAFPGLRGVTHGRERDAGMVRLLRSPSAAGTDRQHPAGGAGPGELSPIGKVGHSGLIQTNGSPDFPGRCDRAGHERTCHCSQAWNLKTGSIESDHCCPANSLSLRERVGVRGSDLVNCLNSIPSSRASRNCSLRCSRLGHPAALYPVHPRTRTTDVPVGVPPGEGTQGLYSSVDNHVPAWLNTCKAVRHSEGFTVVQRIYMGQQ